MEERLRRALEARFHLEGGEERLDCAARHGEAAFGNPGHAPPLFRQLLAARQIDPRDLEEPDGLVSHVDVVARGRNQTIQERRTENRVLRRERIGEPERLLVRVERGQAERVGLREASSDEHVLDQAPQALIRSEGAEHRAPQGQREGDPLQAVDARHLLDEVDLPGDVDGAPGRDGDLPVGAHVEPEPLERAALLVRRDLQSDHAVDPIGAERDDGRVSELADRVDVARPPRAGQLEDELGRERGRLRSKVRVDALLPAVRALGAERMPLGASQDADRLEVGGLEEDVRRPLPDLGVLAAHDPGEGDRPFGVGDDEILRVELARVPVESGELLALARPAHHDLPTAQRVEVEGMQRVANGEHDVVGHVDDIGDRAHACSRDPRLQPWRRGRDGNVREEPADVARAALVVLDAHVRRLRARTAGIAARRRRELS
jgi:hypothetical protein